ncbi:MAG: hypothetical protein IKZ09_11745, partial [Clostridia bacterium]|nr:hypothetical protein [Clostridia bacterium]
RFKGWKTDYLFKPDLFEGLILSDGFGSYDAFNRRDRIGDLSYIVSLPGTITPNGAYSYPIRATDRAMVMDVYLYGAFGRANADLVLPLMESTGFSANGEGHSSSNTYIVLGADSPEEASHIFWDRLWRSWQEDIYKVDPDYFRETMTE